jgi:endonuclease/exonuclease/phosphatase family metal-dependent hydrolase
MRNRATSLKHITAVLCLFLGTISEGQSFKVMSYNIRYDTPSDGEFAWPKRKDFWVSQIRFYEPDVLGIQEALPNQVFDIQSLLPEYDHVGIARDGVNKGESSNIFYKKDRFEVLQESTFWLSETPDVISRGWDAALNRICTYVLLKDKLSQVSFWVFNTHLDHRGELARTNSIRLIVSKIQELNTQDYPVILMGDFNSVPEDERMVMLKNEMLDSRDISIEKPFGPTGTFNGFKHQEPVTSRIDYIFLSKNNPFTVQKYAVLSDAIDLKYPSDHLPVYIELRMN